MFHALRKTGSFVADKIASLLKTEEHLGTAERDEKDSEVNSETSYDDEYTSPRSNEKKDIDTKPYLFGSSDGIEKQFTYCGSNSFENVFDDSSETVIKHAGKDSSSALSKKQHEQNQSKKLKKDNYFGREKRKYKDDSESDVDETDKTGTDTSDYFSGMGLLPAENNLQKARSVPNFARPPRHLQVNVYGGITHSVLGQGNTVLKDPRPDRQLDYREKQTDEGLYERVKERTKLTLQRQTMDGVKTESYIELIDRTKRSPRLVIMRGGNFIARKFLKDHCTHKEKDKNKRCKPYVIKEPEELWVVNKKEHAVIYIPDINWEDRTDTQRSIRWMETIRSELLPMLEQYDNIIVIVTLRIFPDTGIHVGEKFDRKISKFVIDIPKIQLGAKSRRRLIWHELDKNNIELCDAKRPHKDHRKCISNTEIDSIAKNTSNLLFEQRISEYFSSYSDLDKDHLKRPPDEFVKIMKHLSPSQKLSILAVLSCDGKLSETDIEKFHNNQTTEKGFRHSSSGLVPQEKVIKHPLVLKLMREYANSENLHQDMWMNVEKGLRSLRGSICTEINGEYCISDVSLEYAFLLGKLPPPDLVVKVCDDWFFYNLITTSDESRTSQNYFQIQQSQTKEKNAIFERLMLDLNAGKLEDVWTNRMMGERWFCRDFLYFLKVNGKNKQLSPYLFKVDRKGNTVLHYGLRHCFKRKGECENLTELIFQHPSYETKWRTDKRYKNISNIEEEVLNQAVRQNRVSAVTQLIKMGVRVKEALLSDAVEAKNEDMVHTLMETQRVQSLRDNPFSWKTRCQSLKRCLELLSENTANDRLNKLFNTLARYSSINYKLNDVEPLVIMAAKRRDVNMLKFLVEFPFPEMSLGITRTTSSTSVAKLVRKFNQPASNMERIDLDLVTRTGETALTIAVANGCYDMIKYLLDNGADQLKSTGRKMELPIMIAIRRNDQDALKLLVDNKASVVNVKDKNTITPLHMAIQHGSESCFNYILSCKETRIDALNQRNETALHIAVAFGKDRFVSKLLEKGADLQLHDIDKNTPLRAALTLENYYSAEIILKAMKTRRMKPDYNLLFQAVNRKDIRLLGILLTCGYDINWQDPVSGTPLQAAIDCGNYEVVKFLLRHKADPELGRRCIPPIHTLTDVRNIELFDLLLSYGAELDSKKASNGNSVLHTAVNARNHNLIACIMSRDERGLLVDRPNHKGDRALHIACRLGDPDCVRILRQYGASRGVCNKARRTPEDEAKNKLAMQSMFGYELNEAQEVLTALLQQ